jgi:hypothetical protein
MFLDCSGQNHSQHLPSSTAPARGRCGPFVTLANMLRSLNQFVLVSARKSRGGEWWSPDDYDVRDSHGKVVGRIMRHPQAPKDQPWFWTITARKIPPSVHNRGYSQGREQAMADFKKQWLNDLSRRPAAD